MVFRLKHNLKKVLFLVYNFLRNYPRIFGFLATTMNQSPNLKKRIKVALVNRVVDTTSIIELSERGNKVHAMLAARAKLKEKN